MPILDALSILGAGVGKGIRISQETRRQLAEAKRRALIEEQEQRRADTLAALQERLGSSTIASQALGMETDRFTLGEAQRQSTAGQQPIQPSGRFQDVFRQLGIPSNMENIGRNSSVINELLGNASREDIERQTNIFRRDNPRAYGGSREPTVEEQAIKILNDISGPLTQFEALTPEKTAAAFQARQDFVFRNLPLIIAKLKGLRNNTPADSTVVDPNNPLGIER